jgi:tRNA-2-methylthio-N6-dimethylallyladenosine synthase
MNRKYTIGHYKNLVKKIRKHIPDAKISTDIIVGFPGETKKQFENTAKAMAEIGFSKAYIACYSPRPGTAAAKLKDNIPRQEKKRRRKILEKLIIK